ncbi:unnamed protein product [Adineta steineri]|uniref:Uncharacterized protein n=1 Tax=Adineta steineri TaxID=433720 RepID=A0A813XPA0_9BILA|nr:unnamed protein product [Adineta steineri]CAF3976293.1 unnamed protein product [Adineta steineri]
MATANSGFDIEEVIAYQESQLPIKIKYDTWTPRPHFVIVQCTPKEVADNNELQMTYEMIGRFLQQKSQFDINAILCFRRDRWKVPKTELWQARLCVPKESYLNDARIAIKPENIPYPDKDWKDRTNIDNAMRIWLEDKKREGADYKNTCIRQGIPNQNLNGFVPLSIFDLDTSKFNLVWTSPAPRIGIINRSPPNPNTSLADLYHFMEQIYFAMKKELREQEQKRKTFGCHLCLYVRGQSGTAVTCREGKILSEDGQITINQNLVGYIQVSESQYLRWLPYGARETWFNAFHESEHLVET